MARLSGRTGIFFVAAVSGIVSALSFDLARGWFFVWFSLVPLLWILDNTSPKKSFLASLLFGFSFYAAAIFWVAHVTVPGALVLCMYCALYTGLFAVLARFFLKRPAALITIPAAWVLAEFLQENIWCGFGWADLGYSQYRNLWLIQPADIFGVKGISFLIVMANMLIYERLRARARFKRSLIVFSAVIFFCCAYSLVRFATLRTTGTLPVTVIQPNITEEYKWDDALQAIGIQRLAALSAQAPEGALLLYPEAAWPRVVREDTAGELIEFVRSLRRPSLIGAVAKRRDAFYNTALFFDPDGGLVDSYDKIRLVPFGEYVPGRDFFTFISALNSLGDLTRGTRQTRFYHQAVPFGVLICFEDIFPVFVAQAAAGNDFLVNITNDDWFKGQPQARQHYGIMVFRAVENRIPIVRAANTGMSGWVSCRGEIRVLRIGGREVLREGIGTFTIALRRHRSFYSRYPEVFPFLCGMGLLMALVKSRGSRVGI